MREDLKRLWGNLVEGLALKTAERRWVAFQRIGAAGDILPVASGGAGGQRLGDPSSGGLWAIRRALGAGGSVTANSDSLTIVVRGTGGHASAPQGTVDAGVVASQLGYGIASYASAELTSCSALAPSTPPPPPSAASQRSSIGRVGWRR